MTVNINIDNKTIVRILAVTFLFLFTINFISATRHAITLIVISTFLSLALNPPVSYISSRITKGSRGAATGIAYLMVLAIIGLFAWATIPPLVDQSREFANNLPDYVDEVSNSNNFAANFIRDYNIDDEVADYVNEFRFGNGINSASSRVFDSLGKVSSAIASTLTVLVLTFFMLVEGPGWLEKFWEAQPEDKRKDRRALGNKMYNIITGYVNGQLLIALMAATSALIVMLIIGLPLPLPLAGIVGIFGLIPLVGATLGSVTVIVIALFQSVPTAIFMLIFFLVYQQIENSFIQPYVQSKTLDVSPLLVFVAVLFGISLGGLLGAFIAIPGAACIRILILETIEARKRENKKEKSTLSKLKSKVKSA